MPRFSVIVGIHNQRETLAMLIESLKRQTFRDFEVHFCDDGSEDDPLSVINELAAGEFPWAFHTQPHRGMRLARNLNQGVAEAKGEHCLFVMADSMLETDYLEILSGYAREDRVVCGIRLDIDMVGGQLQGVDVDWRVKKGVVPEVPAVVTSSPWLCLTGNGLTVPTWALRAYGGWDEALEGYGGDDNELVARMYYRGLLCWSVPDLHLFHRWHPSRESLQGNEAYVLDKITSYAR